MSEFQYAMGSKLLSNLQLGRHISDVLADYPILLNQILTATPYQKIQIVKEDRPKYLESQLIPIMNHKGMPVGQAITLKDITDQVLLLEKLQQLVAIDELLKRMKLYI